MADSIFNRPLFVNAVGSGQSEKADKAIDLAGRPVGPSPSPQAPVQFDMADIYDDSFMPFDEAGIATLLSTYTQPDAIKGAYAEYAGEPKTAADFAAEYDALTPASTTPESNYKFESSLALARLGLGLMQPTPGGAIAPAISKAGEAFLGDLAAINERKRQDKAKRGEQEAEEDRQKREYILNALKEQEDLTNANEFDLFMKVLQFNMDSDQGNIAFRRKLAEQNFAYKYDVDLMAMENNAKLIAERYKKDPKVFALKPDGLDQTVKYVTGYYGIDPADGVTKPFVPELVDGKVIYKPAPLDAVAANFSFNDDNTLKQDVKAQIAQAEKINTGNQALSFIKDIKTSVADNRGRVGLPGAVKKFFQTVKGTALDIADVLVANELIDADAYESAKNKIDQSVFNDLAASYQLGYPGRNATDFYSDLESDEHKIYQEFFVKPRKNYDPALAANEIKLNSIYYALARARKPTGRLNVDDVNNAKASLSLYDFKSSDDVIIALQAVENELAGFVNAQKQIYAKAGYEEGFLFNYQPSSFAITVKLPAGEMPADEGDPYKNLPEDIN